MYASKQRRCSVVVCILCFPSEHEHGHTELENVFQQDAIFRRSFQSNSIEHLLNTTQKKHQICRRVINFVRYLMRTPSCSTNTSTSTHSRIMSFPPLRRSPLRSSARPSPDPGSSGRWRWPRSRTSARPTRGAAPPRGIQGVGGLVLG